MIHGGAGMRTRLAVGTHGESAARSAAMLSASGVAGLTPAATLADTELDDERVLALDAALDRLAELDDRKARVVELRFFAGCRVEDIARMLGVSERTVERDWDFSRVWLYTELSDREAG